MTNEQIQALKADDGYKIPSMPKCVSAQDMRETLNIPMFEEESQAAANGFNQCILECAPIYEAAKRIKRGIDECLDEMDGMQQSINYGYKKRHEWRERAEKAESTNISLLAERDADKALIAEQAKRIADLEAEQTTEIGQQILIEAIGAHGYIVGCLNQGRPDLALAESLKWVEAFSVAAHDVGGE